MSSVVQAAVEKIMAEARKPWQEENSRLRDLLAEIEEHAIKAGAPYASRKFHLEEILKLASQRAV